MRLPHTSIRHTNPRRSGGLNKTSIFAALLFLRLTTFWRVQAAPQLFPTNYDEEFRRNDAVEYGAPLITPLMDYVTLELNTNYTIRCEADEPLTWRLPDDTVDYDEQTFNTGDPQRLHGSMLYLQDISSKNLGNYYCIKKSSVPNRLDAMLDEELVELVNNYKASSIYIYVNDPVNLLSQNEFPVISALQYQDTVIPCKPTMPNIEVLLTTSHGETFSSENTGRYNPQRGFVVEIRGVTDGGSYVCRPKVPSPLNEEEEQTFEILFSGNEPVNPVEMGMDVDLNVDTTNLGDGNVVNENKRVFGVETHNSNILANVVGLTNGDGYDTTQTTTLSGYKNAKVVNNYTDDSLTDIDNGDRIVVEENHIYENAPQRSTCLRSTKRPLLKRAAPTTRWHSSRFRGALRSSTKYIEKPIITSNSRGHVNVGENFTLNCYVKIAFDVSYSTEWKTPPGVDEDRMIKTIPTFINKTSTHQVGEAKLTILNSKKSDSGLYECICTDHSKNVGRNNYQMTVLNRDEGYINISEPSGYYKIASSANKKVQINVKYRGYPFPTLTWYKPDNTQIHPSKKYIINTTDTSITLQIVNAQLEDSGEYVIRAKNELLVKELKFNVSISDKPKVTVEDVYVQAGEEAHLQCKVLSFPFAVVSWVFTPCSISPRWPSCNKRMDQNFNSTRNAQPGATAVEYIHDLFFTPERPGIMHCLAVNPKGMGEGKGHVLIGDINDNMTIYGTDENKKIARGDEVTLTCAALSYYFSDDLDWYKDGELVEENSGNFVISNSSSSYSYQKTLVIENIQDSDQGSYECRARNANNPDMQETKYRSIFVNEPLAPRMRHTNLDESDKMERKLGDALQLECKPDAIPAAEVHWYKDDVELNNSSYVNILDDGSKLIIQYIKPEHEGVYKCVASNRLGTVEVSSAVKITNLPRMRVGWILAILFFFIFLIALVIYLCVRVMRERKRLRDYKAAGLANFEDGAVEHINPALTLDEQADLLPYDRAFEFPREKLKLGKQLGAGAFGVVLKAHAEGIRPDEKETVVAVKMVKRIADNEVMRALVTELKILVHLGPNLNVVNLLGAVTKNIAKRELMVIVEYCRYGNVQNFLLRNRKRFINQINPETDKIDPTITKQRFSDNFELNRDGVRYVNLAFANHQYVNHMNNMNNNYTANNRRNSDEDPRSGTRAGRPNSTGYLRQSDLYEGHVDSCATEQTVMTTIPEDDDNVLSNNSVQPAWRSNYKPDSTEAMTITTTQLVSWAFQVARAMDYLSSRKVLHGDLAARNILLCEDNVVKICDFGLARSMYKSENYKKQGEAPLPIKWLALESLSDHIFSTYTDVWSFGIVLWEFFSLAKVPYPGMDPNQSLYLKIKDGYRMEKPPYANNELYDIMLECWSTNPESRPLFKVLEKYFARMLGEDVTNHYVDLNDTYLRANMDNANTKPTDYLSLMGSPDEMAPAPPRYVNGHILPEIRIQPSTSDDYLNMSIETGTTIFSPTRPKDYQNSNEDTNTTTTTSFTFPDNTAPTAPPTSQHSPTLVNNLDSAINKNRKKEGMQPEEIPMLTGTHHNSDDGDDSPAQDRKFAKNILQQHVRATPTPSPRHHIAETELSGSDNYVNVNSPKKLNNNGARAADAFSNPSYQILKTVSKEVDNK
ncbi:PREDICTED: platelet-derived growth factor receptor alpha isoform X1 [Bactrocera latifrons]|uniref:platelet-derived growth factor receptor alpha isoform X1 n=1 Tax=Bactrocera latifrons TaxID=174628 RepID=UPI0008DC7536|nr:PREDICTED: platelet-derived growth factor receptor alpha isoform X1 [Bactrocera latifrons]XP_018798447.1 PREDICTED: platelet-derived growth factor receptor alpha isoform X1 [Bactrocera latifrons]